MWISRFPNGVLIKSNKSGLYGSEVGNQPFDIQCTVNWSSDKKFSPFFKSSFVITSMLVTDVGDKIHVGLKFEMLATDFVVSVTNILYVLSQSCIIKLPKISLTWWFCHQYFKLSPTPLRTTFLISLCHFIPFCFSDYFFRAYIQSLK